MNHTLYPSLLLPEKRRTEIIHSNQDKFLLNPGKVKQPLSETLSFLISCAFREPREFLGYHKDTISLLLSLFSLDLLLGFLILFVRY